MHGMHGFDLRPHAWTLECQPVIAQAGLNSLPDEAPRTKWEPEKKTFVGLFVLYHPLAGAALRSVIAWPD